MLCDITLPTALQSRKAKIEFDSIQFSIQHSILGIEAHADFGDGFILKDEQELIKVIFNLLSNFLSYDGINVFSKFEKSPVFASFSLPQYCRSLTFFYCTLFIRVKYKQGSGGAHLY